MKVLHLLSSNSFSGAENVVCQIINMFKDELEMIYCCPDGPISEKLSEKNVKYLPIKKLSYMNVKKAIRYYKPDIIHAHDIRASVLAAQCSGEIPVISHIHGKFNDMKKLSIKSLVYRAYNNKFSHILAVSKSILKEFHFEKAISNKCSVLYNVVNPAQFSDIQGMKITKKYDCVFLGRFSYAKNPKRLIEIISRVVKVVPNASFVLIGDGILLDEVKNHAVSLNVDKNIVFTGFLNNPYKLLSSSKVMIMSSRSEGTPMCVLEAMLLGVPIVSTAVDGITEIIEHGVDGFYYDDNDQIASAICKLITDENMRKNVSNKVSAKAKLLNDVENYKTQLTNIYSSI